MNPFQDPAPVAPADGAANAADGVVAEESFLFLNLPDLWIIGLVVVPAVLAFSWWSYGGLRRLEPRTRAILATLRGLAIATCILLLFQPAFERVRYTKVQSQVHVLVDDSASMQRRDTYPDADQREALLEAAGGGGDLAGRTRAELVRSVLSRDGGLLDGLDETYDLRLFRFERKPVPIRDLGELQSRGARTQIGDALDLHLGAASAVNLDALVLVSDGRNNAGLSPDEVAEKYRLADIPIYTVGVGDPNPPRNIRLIGPPGPKDALREEEVGFDVTLDAEGLEGRDVTVTLEASRDGGPYRTVATANATLGEDHVPVKARLFHAFEEEGDWTLRFEVGALPEETSQEDNTAVRFLRVNDEKIRVLFVDHRARWEYRYTKNALMRVDPSIEVQVYLCDAAGTFEQEHSDGLAPLRAIPRTRDELFEYHVILLGDVPPEEIAKTEEELYEWLSILVDFVEFGGGLGCIWGTNAMPERYRGSALEDLLPVVLEDPLDYQQIPRDWTREFRPRLETPTLPHDIVQLQRDPATNRRLWETGFRGIRAWYPVKQAKAGATVLLRHPTADNRYGGRVIAATSYFPRGNTFFMATDEAWRWRDPYGEKYYDTFWRNVVRHLASGRLRRRDDRVDLRVDKVTVETGQPVQISLLVHDDEFQPTASGEYPVFVRTETDEPVKRVLRALPGELGNFQGSFTLDQPGTYSFLVFRNDNPGDLVLAREDVFVKIPDREMADSSQDRDGLERIAANSKGGRFVFLADAEELMDDLGGQRTFDHEVDRSTRPIWDDWWSLLLVLGLLGAEWILRKRARLV